MLLSGSRNIFRHILEMEGYDCPLAQSQARDDHVPPMCSSRDDVLRHFIAVIDDLKNPAKQQWHKIPTPRMSNEAERRAHVQAMLDNKIILPSRQYQWHASLARTHNVIETYNRYFLSGQHVGSRDSSSDNEAGHLDWRSLLHWQYRNIWLSSESRFLHVQVLQLFQASRAS